MAWRLSHLSQVIQPSAGTVGPGAAGGPLAGALSPQSGLALPLPQVWPESPPVLPSGADHRSPTRDHQPAVLFWLQGDGGRACGDGWLWLQVSGRGLELSGTFHGGGRVATFLASLKERAGPAAEEDALEVEVVFLLNSLGCCPQVWPGDPARGLCRYGQC